MKRVAVVDDVPDNRLLICSMLEDDYELDEYADGPSALEGLAATAVDLVLLDISLPQMDGFEVLKRLRASAAHARTPVVALTAHAMIGDRERFIAAGFAEHVAKPVTDPAALIELIARLADG